MTGDNVTGTFLQSYDPGITAKISLTTPDNSNTEYVILDEASSTEQYAVGCLKGNTQLRDAVNAELKKMAQDGTMLQIAQKYVDSGLVIESLCMLAD